MNIRKILAIAAATMVGGAYAIENIVPLTNFTPGESWWSEVKGNLIYQNERTPGSVPFVAPEEVIIEGKCEMECKVELVIFESWHRIAYNLKPAHTYYFTGTWNRVSARIKTPLPKNVKYRLNKVTLLTSAAKIKKAGGFSVTAIKGAYNESAAEVARLEVTTGTNRLHIVRDATEMPVVEFSNGSAQTQHWRGTIDLNDLFAHWRSVPFDLTVPAGRTGRMPIALPLEKGLWRVVANIRGEDGSRATRQTRFAVIDRHEITPRMPKGKYRIGLNYHRERYLPTYKRLCDDAVVACGAKMVRGAVHPRRTRSKKAGELYDFSATDRDVAEMHRRGLDIDALLNYGGKREELAAYGEALTKHYGDDIAYYEIGNEWELPGFFSYTTQDAIDIVKKFATGMRKGDPKATITLCGWAAAGDIHNRTTNTNIQQVLMKETKGLYDVHAMHLHGAFPSFRKRFTEQFLPNRKKWGIDVPIYMNETAQTTTTVGELEVAACVWKKIAFSWAYGSTDYIWYNLRATGYDPTDGEQGYGIMSATLYPRGSYAALSAFMAIFGGWDRPTILRSDIDGECYLFKGERDGEKEQILLGWYGEQDAKTIDVEVKTDAKRAFVCDIMNNQTELPIRDGKVVWGYGALPTALRLVGATRVEADEKKLNYKLPPPFIRVKGGEEPDFVCNQQRYVHEYFGADPFMAHRIWKGANDCSLKAWFSTKTNEKGVRYLTCRFEVTDDIDAIGPKQDRLRLKLWRDNNDWDSVFYREKNGRAGCWVWTKLNTTTNIDITNQQRKKLIDRMHRKITRVGNVTRYELEIDTEALGYKGDPLNGTLGVSFFAVDDDGEGEDSHVGILSVPYILKK